jgi:hypothetical protein
VTYDLRGHRESGPSTDGYTLDGIAGDALAVADARVSASSSWSASA